MSPLFINSLHEAAILNNLFLRFRANQPYTYTGNICIAVNPYHWIADLYQKDLHEKVEIKSSKFTFCL